MAPHRIGAFGCQVMQPTPDVYGRPVQYFNPMITAYRAGSRAVVDPGQLPDILGADETVWVDVANPSPEELGALTGASEVLRGFDLDRMRLGRPPRTKVIPDALFVRCYAVMLDGDLRSHEIHAIATPRSLITMRYGPPFDLQAVAERWQGKPEQIGAGGGALLAVLLDEVVDDYFDAVDAFEEAADGLENRVFSPSLPDDEREAGRQNEAVQRDVHHLRGELAKFRRAILPYGEVRELAQRAPSFVTPEDASEFRDIADAVLRVIELIDNARDQLTSTFEAALAQVSNQLNITMKKLSAWAAILLVPTLIAGIYGMNFEGMPELRWRFGYPGALLGMAASAAALYAVFRKRNWL